MNHSVIATLIYITQGVILFLLGSAILWQSVVLGKKLKPWAHIVLDSVLLSMVCILIVHLFTQNRLPLASLPEALFIIIFFSLTILRLLPHSFKETFLPGGILILFSGIAILLTTPFLIKPFHPSSVLTTPWLAAHVLLALFGEACFMVGAACALGRIANDLAPYTTYWSHTFPDINLLAKTEKKVITIGYLFFSIGALAMGMLWALKAWGRAWSFVIKETLSLVTWVIFTLYLTPGFFTTVPILKPILAIVAFLMTVITIMSSLLPGSLHSY